MKNLKENKNNSNTFSSITMISIMITLLTFSAALNTSLELAAEGGGEEYDDIDIDSIKNSELSTLSLSSLPTRQGMNIGNIATDSNNVPSHDSLYFAIYITRTGFTTTNRRSHHKCCLWTGLKWSGKINIGPQL